MVRGLRDVGEVVLTLGGASPAPTNGKEKPTAGCWRYRR
jgi:hypothetical protein